MGAHEFTARVVGGRAQVSCTCGTDLSVARHEGDRINWAIDETVRQHLAVADPRSDAARHAEMACRAHAASARLSEQLPDLEREVLRHSASHPDGS